MIQRSEQDAVVVKDIPFVDWGRVQSLVEKVSKDPDQELKVRFVRTVFANLDTILKQLADDSSPLPQRLERLLEAAQAIEDMAMIHGYEGIETIARNVREAVASVDPRTERSLPATLARKISMAAEAIQKILEFTDALNERLLVDSTTSNMTKLESSERGAPSDEPVAEPEVEERGPVATDASGDSGDTVSEKLELKSPSEEQEVGDGEFPDELFSLAGEAEEEATELPFDIREANELLELMAGDENGNDEAAADLDVTAREDSTAFSGEDRDLRELFADVLRGEIREVVGALTRIARSEKTVSVGHVDNAVFVLEGLAETAEKLRDAPLAELSRTLITYLSDRPKVDSLLSPESKETIGQVIQALEAYSEDPSGTGDRLKMVAQRLRERAGQEEDESEIFDDALLSELQKKLEREEAGEPDQNGGLKGKIRRLFGLS